MKNIKIEPHGSVAVLRLSNGVINAINPEMVDELLEAVKEVRSRFEGMILAGNDKFFSIGLDLPRLMGLDQTEMTTFWHRFDQLIYDLFTLPLPTAAAVAGHATAGGCILALTGDYRLLSSGKKWIGLNEVKLGLPVPYLTDLMLRLIVGDRTATDMTYRGYFLDPDRAHQTGLADEVLEADAVEKRAVELISEIAAHPQTGFATIKSQRVAPVAGRWEQNREKTCAHFLACWYDEETVTRLEAACQKF